MAKERIIFLDLAKGICMTLLVMFHCNVDYDFHGVFQHMWLPMFFFLSGSFFKDYGGIVKTVIRKIDSFLMPLCFFGLLIAIALYLCPSGGDVSLSSFVWSFIHLRPIHTVWFLACMFTLNIGFYILIKIVGPSQVLQLLAVLAITACGWILSYMGVRLPMYIDTSMAVLPIFYLGYLVKNVNLLDVNVSDKICVVSGMGCWACSFIIAYFFPAFPEIVNNHYPGSFPPIYYLECALMLFGLLFLCKAVKRLPVVSFVGRYSIVVLGMHRVVMPFVVVLAGRLGINLTPELEFLIVYALCVVSIKPMIKLFPYFTAQKYLLSNIYAKLSQSIQNMTAKG